MKHHTLYTALVIAASLFLLAACGGATPAPTPEPVAEEPTEAVVEETEVATEEPTEEPTPTEAPWEPPVDNALVSVPAAEEPTLDGDASDAVWADAPELTIEVSGGANMGETDVKIKSVYTADKVYFLVVWADPTQSFIRAPWVKQEDGTWKKLNDPNDKGGDNNLYYEDKLAFIWSIANSIPGFDTQGCFTACHAGENSDVKPFGNKYTAEEGQLGDIWHWKSVRNLNQIDDQYLDWTHYSAETPEAGRKSDPKDSGGYANNETEDKTMPAFMGPEGFPVDGSPGFILDSEKVPFDDSKFKPGDMIPAIIKSEIVGDRGNIAAGWQYVDGSWVLEFGRDLVTGSEFDVQFDDLAAIYYFGVAAFDNAQVRHAFQQGATPFVFKPAE